jgi:hypothetical protein
MPQATEWSKVILQSMRGGLVNLARRTDRLKEGPCPSDAQPHHEDEDPVGPLVDILEDHGPQVQLGFRPRLVSSPKTSSATLRAARSRQPRQAVPHA